MNDEKYDIRNGPVQIHNSVPLGKRTSSSFRSGWRPWHFQSLSDQFLQYNSMQSGRKSALSIGKRAWRTGMESFRAQASSSSSGTASTAATALRRAYTSETAATVKNMVNDMRLGRSTRGAFALPAVVAAALAAAGTTVGHCSARTEQTFIMVKPDGVNRGSWYPI